MLKVVIDKSKQQDPAQKAAFAIVKDTVERSFKALEKEIDKEGGKVTITITGPGAFDVAIDGLSLKLRKKIASATKKLST